MRVEEEEGIEAGRNSRCSQEPATRPNTAMAGAAKQFPGDRPPVEALGSLIASLEARLGVATRTSADAEFAQALKDAGARLTRLADDLSRRSSEPSARPEPESHAQENHDTTLTVGHETVALGDIAAAVAHACYATEMKTRGVRLSIDRSLPLARVDRRDLEKVFFVLVGAALDRIGTRQAPEIRISAARTDDGHVVWVADNGLSRDVCSFPQRAVTAIEGLVDTWGGRAWTDTRPGPETTVFFTLPRGAHAAATSRPETADL